MAEKLMRLLKWVTNVSDLLFLLATSLLFLYFAYSWLSIRTILLFTHRCYAYPYFGNLRISIYTNLAKSSLLGTDGWFKQVSLSFFLPCVETSRGLQKSFLKQMVISTSVIRKMYFCRKLFSLWLGVF